MFYLRKLIETFSFVSKWLLAVFAIKGGQHHDRIIMIGKITKELSKRKTSGFFFYSHHRVRHLTIKNSYQVNSSGTRHY